MTTPLFASEAEFREYEDERTGVTGLATMDDAHREWHRNAGVPMGQGGCPQDACDPSAEDEPYIWIDCVYCGGAHPSAAELRGCAAHHNYVTAV